MMDPIEIQEHESWRVPNGRPHKGFCKQRPVATIHSLIAGACSKGCQGPLLHTVRRYGALGCRFTGPSEEVQHDSCVVKKKQNR